ncbi:MAG: L,D-transpeptidase [Gammaproteobacteria bacterium]|nr:L,D-transpeptidase [Gammaproteobacteria bacterium]
MIVVLYTLPAYALDDIWLLIDTQKQELEVKQADVTLRTFSNISIGRNGSGFKEKRGDDITPKGKYKISWVNRESRFHLFYGFNYPSQENARTALRKKLITPKDFIRIMIAHKKNRLPPQDTPMGGMIGIHGLGQGDRKIHETMNWTHGCIALTNKQINNLDTLINRETIVIVK